MNEELLASLDVGYEGFAMANAETLTMLAKALEAGSGVDAGLPFSGGRALIPESLEQTLVNILHTQDEAVLFQALKKVPVKGPVHQWDERTEVGADDGAWVPEGGDSEEADQTIKRVYITMKYLQTLRKVTLQMSISNSIEDATALEQNAGTLWLIRNIERKLFYGDSALVTEQPDGLKKLIPATNIIDVRGADASSADYEDKMNEACRIIRENYGKASLMLTSTMVMEDVQKLLRDRIRFEAGETVGSAVFSKYPTPFGSPKLKEDIFIQEGGAPAASALTTKRPTVVTVDSVARAGSGAEVSQWGANDAGDYYYTVVGVNRYGDAVAAVETQCTSIVADDKVTITVTEGAIPCTAYKVYRSKKDAAAASTLRYLGTYARVTGSSEALLDLNANLPGCSDNFVLTMDALYDAISWAQFLPMMKFNLYPTNAAVYPFLMLLFGALALKKPVQHVRIKNIAPSTLGWF